MSEIMAMITQMIVVTTIVDTKFFIEIIFMTVVFVVK
jgi:hypothetical protein